MTARQFVPFADLWAMPIDVPYSLLVRDGEHAWSCGQLALDADAAVLACGDLAAQSEIVAGYVDTLLRRADLRPEHLTRLVLYHAPDVAGSDAVGAMIAVFRTALGEDVLLDLVPVPHFYYDGILLEVDAFAGPPIGDRYRWQSVDVPLADLGRVLETIDRGGLICAHWNAPAASVSAVAADLARGGLVHDAGAVVSAGPDADRVRGALLAAVDGEVVDRSVDAGDVRLTVRRAGHADGAATTVWVAARSTERSSGLVGQTEQIMDAVAEALATEGLDFSSVVKSTTLYVGGSSAKELHDNMAVRNRRYRAPGPASTGLPIFGLADPASHLTVDVLCIA